MSGLFRRSVTRAELALPSGASLVGYQRPEAGAIVTTVQNRIHRDFVYVTDFGGDPTGAVDSTAAVLAAIATGKLVWVDGFFLISATLSTMLAGMVGDGPQKSGLIANGVHAITIQNNVLGRRHMRLEEFSIDSLGDSCDSKFAVYAPGVAEGAHTSNNSGLKVLGLEIGRTGRMGGGFYIKDFFRVDIEEVGMTDVSHMIRIVGSVVQMTAREVRSNNDNAASVLSKYGISTESATYSDTGVMGLENGSFERCAYIRGQRGINLQIAGSAVEFQGFDTEADQYGAMINAPCVMRGGILSPGIAAVAWTGVFRGVSISEPDDGTLFDAVDIKVLRAVGEPENSYGFDLGDGISPVYGAVLENCLVRGTAGSLQSAIRGRDCRDLTVVDCKVRTAVTLGDDIDVRGRRLMIERNRIPGGTIKVSDGGDTDAYGSVQFNQATLAAFNPVRPNQWSLMFNENAIPGRRFPHVITATAVVDPANIVDGAVTQFNVACNGASPGDAAIAAVDIGARTVFLSAHVSAVDTVRVSLMNKDGLSADLPSQTVRVWVFKAT